MGRGNAAFMLSDCATVYGFRLRGPPPPTSVVLETPVTGLMSDDVLVMPADDLCALSVHSPRARERSKRVIVKNARRRRNVNCGRRPTKNTAERWEGEGRGRLDSRRRFEATSRRASDWRSLTSSTI